MQQSSQHLSKTLKDGDVSHLEPTWGKYKVLLLSLKYSILQSEL